MLSTARMIARPIPRRIFPRNGERQSPLLGGEGWVRTVVKPILGGSRQSLAFSKEPGNGGAMKLIYVLTLALILAFSPGERISPAMLSTARMIARPIPRQIFPRSRERQSPLLGGEGWVRTVVQLTLSPARFGFVYSGKGCGARVCSSLKMASRTTFASRRRREFQNRSVLMPSDCRNFSRSKSCFR